jgi:hypothetical protein
MRREERKELGFEVSGVEEWVVGARVREVKSESEDENESESRSEGESVDPSTARYLTRHQLDSSSTWRP